jgi:hypothetical protein
MEGGRRKNCFCLQQQENNKNLKQQQQGTKKKAEFGGSGMYLVPASPAHDGGREFLRQSPHRVSHLQCVNTKIYHAVKIYPDSH